MGLEPTISCLGSKRSRVHLNIGELVVPKLICENYTLQSDMRRRIFTQQMIDNQVLSDLFKPECAGVALDHVGGFPTSHFHQAALGCPIQDTHDCHGSAQIVDG